MKYKDLTAGRNYRDLPRLPEDEVRLLWHDDFWDGPLSGVLEYRGERLWYLLHEEAPESEPGWYRRFLVVRLTPDQLREEEYWQDLFGRCVGTHADYGDSGRVLGELQPKERWSEFYDAYAKRAPMDLTENEVVGWFVT
jgi:hypothetical protein